MEEKKVSDKSIIVWRIRATAVLVGIAFLVGAVFVFSHLLAVVIGTAALAAYVVLVVIYYPLLYKSISYTFYDNEITVTKGVIYRRKCTVPSARVQYVVMSQGPVQKVFDVCSLSFMMAGSFEILANIPSKEAENIKSEIEKKSSDRK